MPPDLFEGIMAVTVIITLGSLVLVGMKMRYQYKSKTLGKPQTTEDVERLTEAVEGLYERTDSLHEEVVELHERVDLHERLVTKSKDEGLGTAGKRHIEANG